MKKIFTYTIVITICLWSCSNDNKNNAPNQRDQPNLEAGAKTNKKSGDEAKRIASTPEQLAKANTIINATTAEALSKINGKELYKNYCTSCHGFTGDLNVNLATDLTTSTLPLEERVAQIYFGRGLMTPFKGLLKEEEVVAVSKYVEVLRR